MHIRCPHCQRLAAVARKVIAGGRTVLIATCAVCLLSIVEPHEPPAAEVPPSTQVAVAVASGAPGASPPPFGWNSTAQDLPPASRHRTFAAVMGSGDNAGWLVQHQS